MKYKEITVSCGCLTLTSYDQGKTWIYKGLSVEFPNKWQFICKKCGKTIQKTEKIVEAIKE